MPVPQSGCHRERPGEGGHARIAWLREPRLKIRSSRLFPFPGPILYHELAHDVMRVLELRPAHERRVARGLLMSTWLDGAFPRRRPQYRDPSVDK
jgi:hypothetical protein